jgi:hypothetical protein
VLELFFQKERKKDFAALFQIFCEGWALDPEREGVILFNKWLQTLASDNPFTNYPGWRFSKVKDGRW